MAFKLDPKKLEEAKKKAGAGFKFDPAKLEAAKAAAQAAPQEQAPVPSMGERFMRGLRQEPGMNDPGITGGDVAEFIGREGPTMAGATLGGAAGPVGAGVGAAAGKAGSNVLASLLTQGASDKGVVGNVIDPLVAGAANAAFAKGAESAGAAFKALKQTPAYKQAQKAVIDPVNSAVLRPVANRALDAYAKLVRVLTGQKERITKRLLKNPRAFQGPSVEEAGAAQAELVKAAGYKSGLPAQREVTGQAIPTKNRGLNSINKAMDKLAEGKLTVQEAIATRQIVSRELGRPKFQNELNGQEKAALADVLWSLDDIVEAAIPGFKQAVSNTADAFAVREAGNILPVNQNLSPNVLRSGAALALGAGSSLNPLLAIPAALMSPAVATSPIRMAGRLMTSAPQIGRAGTAAGAQGMTRAIQQALMEQGIGR